MGIAGLATQVHFSLLVTQFPRKKSRKSEETAMNCSYFRKSARVKMKWYAVGLVATALLIIPTKGRAQGAPPAPVQIVALDECDPATFNAALGADFCKNVTLGAFTKLQDLFAGAAAGNPDPNWDFEPDVVKIKKGTPIVVTDQGGEPHTFTEVKHFGGGFIPGLNAGEATVSECSEGFKNLAVARTRILQGSQLQIADLAKGEHYFQCCIHPWMRVKVEVGDNNHDHAHSASQE
jgi:plastocyanin